jgi:methionyl-tRNA formyltransferase
MPASVVFMGTPDFAVPSLQALIDHGYDVRAVVTNPDRPAGRGLQTSPPAIKQAAARLGVPLILQPDTLRGPDTYDALRALAPDLLVVAAYGRILGPRYLNLPRVAPVNVHASLLPRYRGAAPIQWSIIRGEAESGVCIMRMEAGMDTGAVYHRGATPISLDDTAGALHDRLAPLGARLLTEALPAILAGQQPTPQDDALATYAPMLHKPDGALRFDEPARRVHDRARGVTPWPGAACAFRGKPLKVFASRWLDDDPLPPNTPPGAILDASAAGLTIACQPGRLLIQSLQPAGRAAMKAADFINGYRLQPSDALDPDPTAAARRD